MYNELVVLGDSLSDQGNVYTITDTLIPPPEYTDGTHSGRFTNGLNYIDYLAPSLGLTVAPSVLGGTNYA
jgi:outer membrane lipase/esterase